MNRQAFLVGLAALGVSSTQAAESSGDDALEQVTIQGTRYTSEVTVGGKMPQSQRSIPSSVSVITEQRMEDQNLLTVADALTQVPGVTVIPNDSVQSQYKSRGYSLAVMNDGVPAYNSLGGYQQLDLALYQRVEVLRGPAGVLQGSSEPGGTVNLVRKRGSQDFGVTTALTGGSWNAWRGVLDATGPLNSSGSLRARAVGVYQDSDYFTDITSSAKRVGYVAVDWDVVADTTLSLAAIVQNDRIRAPYSGLPAYDTGELLDVARSTILLQPWVRNRWKTYDYEAGVTHRFAGGWVVRAIARRRDQNFFFHDAYNLDGVRASDNTVPFGRREYDYDYRREGADLFLSGPLQLFGRTHSLLLGYNYDSFDSRYSGIALTSNALAIRQPLDRPDLLPDFSLPYNEGGLTETRQDGFYAQGRFSLADPLTLSVGVRSTDFHVRSRDLPPSTLSTWRQGNRANDKVTPYGGVVYDLNTQVSLYASYSSIFIPQSTILRFDGSSLDPRIGRQYEVGSKADFLDRRLTLSVALFDLRDRNRSLSDAAHPGFSINAGEVESKGWEAQVSGSPAPGYEVQAGYARLDTKSLTASPAQQGKQFDLLEPRHSWKLWGVRRFAWAHDSGVTVGLGVNIQSGVRVDPSRGEGGFTVANALLGYRFGPRMTIDLNASNLLDKVYYSRLGGTNSYNTYGNPRSYSVTFRGTL